MKLIVLAIPPLTVAGFLWVAREVHGRIPPTALFAIPFAYGHPFLFGFVNFALSMALAFLAFGLWLRLGRTQPDPPAGDPVRADLADRLFLPHLRLGRARPAVLFRRSGAPARSRNRLVQGGRRRRRSTPRSWRCRSSSPWSGAARRTGGPTGDWFNWKLKFMWLEMALRDRWRWFDMASVAAVFLVLVEALRNRRLSFSRNLAFSALVLIAGFILLPADHFRLRLRRHAPGALHAGGAGARHPLSRRDRSQDRHRACARRAAVLRRSARLEHRQPGHRRRTTSRPSSPRSIISQQGARVASLVGLPCGEPVAAAAQQPSRRRW